MVFGVIVGRSRVCFVTLFVLILSFSPSLSGFAQTRGRDGRTAPRSEQPFNIQEPIRGAAIIDVAGSRFAEIADRYQQSVAELSEILRHDDSVWMDRAGLLLHVCAPSTSPDRAGEDELLAPSQAVTSLVTAAQVPLLHSRATSTRKIYLDFDGHTTTGTMWNQLAGKSEIVTPAFDFDGNPASFNPIELQRIQGIWQRVAEDFAPFDVDVTTEEPAASALSKDSSTDQQFGTRVVIGGSSLDWYGQTAGGTSYVGSFSWEGDTPCFVFDEQLGNGNEKYTAEAVSHETGHALGLFHDGQTNGTIYYSGHAAWAPIMGTSYDKEVSQWSKGDYPMANNRQDDLTVMLANGLSYRADDHGDQAGTATRLTGLYPSASGIIERSSDADVFSFSTGSGTVSFNVAVAAKGANLDVLATILDAGGKVLAAGNSPALTAAVSASVAAGTYYLRIEGTGTGDPSTGYDKYDSLGQYTLSGVTVSTADQPPSARAAADTLVGNAPLRVTFSSAGTTDPDSNITDYLWTFGDGSSSSAPNPIYTYTRAGTFLATLSVTDKSGLNSRTALTITVKPPPNQAPVANALASSTRGPAPLNVNFSSAGSEDPDGAIASYFWDFGTGITSSDSNPSYIYNRAGSYTARLTVTDNEGLQTTSLVAIEVTAPVPPPLPAVYVGEITVTIRPTRKATERGRAAVATVVVKDTINGTRPRALVSGYWSGVTSGSVSGYTDATGRVAFTSQNSTQRGDFVFIVSTISANGFVYDPQRNAETDRSTLNQ